MNQIFNMASVMYVISKYLFNSVDCIEKMKGDYEENRMPLSDDSQHLQRFCAKLEFLLQAGIKR